MKNFSKKKILLISHFFPPIKAMGSIRVFNLAKTLSRRHNIFILTSKGYGYKKDFSFYNDFNKLKIYRILNFDFKLFKINKILKFFIRKKQLPSILAKINSFYKNIFYEGGFSFIIIGYIIGFYLIKKNKIDVIISSFSPLVSHVTAYLLKKTFPNILWIADFRDLRVNMSSAQKEIQREKKLIKEADFIFTVSKGLKKEFQKILRDKKIMVLSNCILEDIVSPLSQNIINEKKFIISYTGRLYFGKRDPTPILIAIKNLIDEKKIDHDDILFLYAGMDFSYFKILFEKIFIRYEKGMIKNLGEILWKDSIAIHQISSVNLLLTWADKNNYGILTGKLFEYIAAKKPIVAIISGDKDKELEDIIENNGLGIVCYQSSIKKLEDYILNIYKKWKAQEDISFSIIPSKFFCSSIYQNYLKDIIEKS